MRYKLFENVNKLVIFDFDDTIVKTDSYIYVTHRNGKKTTLTPGEYAVYDKQPGDTFDYSDFSQVTRPVLIKAYVELLRRMVKSAMGKTVYILTARAAYKPVYDFIKSIGIRNVMVIALGDSNPEKKADWIEQQIKDKGYSSIFFADDSPKNVDAVKNRLKAYPDIEKTIKLVTHS